MKISLITVVYNGEAYLEDCFQSVFAQTHPDVEYIVIDGGSTDGTLKIIDQHKNQISYFVSESDRGLYDAINKGIAKATGDIVGILNADDTLASPEILKAVAETFTSEDTDVLYGDLHYVHPSSGKIIRKWKSKQATRNDMEKGWMPAHPTLYLKRTLFENHGNYALDLGTAADYELILRFLYKNNLKARYLPQLMVNMRTGGVSNGSIKSLFNALLDDYKAMKRNGIPNPVLALIMKKLSKLKQFR
ncbi:glycosyltransferase family 2 protein [Pedobacter frigidisoli]|uniref:glycosyltransferase family 2 protein n=1 Tax=Pedobacter frigidisoli TaxID=2530455 RepID=UPI00292E3751|nr:glycosyltransferase family 2 protein [Pedobacter frigidisoli]